MFLVSAAAYAAPFDADVAALASATGVDDEFVGYALVTTDTWRAYAHLREVATAEELRALTTHPAPVVRAYALQALAEVEPDPASLFLAVSGDRAGVAVRSGCTEWGTTIADLALTELAPRMSDADLARVLGTLLVESPPLEWTCHVVLGRAIPDSLADLLVHQADQGWDCALPALATLRRPEDLPRIRAAVAAATWAGWTAAAMFPDPSLLDAVRAVPPEALRNPVVYFHTVAAFGGAAVDLLERADPAKAPLVFDAAAEHADDPAFQPLLFTLWERGQVPDCPTFDVLLAADPDRAARALAATLLPRGLSSIDSGCNAHLLQAHAELTGPAGRAALLDALVDPRASAYGDLAAEAARQRLPEAVDLLLDQVRRGDNPFDVLAAIDALFAYHDPAVTARALEVGQRRLKHPRTLRYWGREALADRLAAALVHPPG